jgi:hypothetical protein
MLAELIKSISTFEDTPGKSLWDYRIAGNILELSVKPDYNDNPDEYRLSVIETGKVLQAIEHQAILSGLVTQVQSFPNIEESQLVALVRLHRLYGTVDEPAPRGLKQESNTPAGTLLKSVASHYGLFFQNQNTHNDNNKILEIFHSDQKKLNNKGCYYSLCSTMDNPFLWLKTGQWIKRVNQLIEENSSLNNPVITFNLTRNERVSLNALFSNCSYVQALVQLK